MELSLPDVADAVALALFALLFCSLKWLQNWYYDMQKYRERQKMWNTRRTGSSLKHRLETVKQIMESEGW